jgi:hypothetical protein
MQQSALRSLLCLLPVHQLQRLLEKQQQEQMLEAVQHKTLSYRQNQLLQL